MPVATHFGPRAVTTPRTSYGSFDVGPVGTCLGAEIQDVDLSRPVGADLWGDLHQALLDWKVIFFRDQDITAEQHRDLAARWGELEVHPFLPAGDLPEVVRFAKDDASKGVENIWHSDVTWRQVPSLGSVLRAVEVPPVGGDTLWADMAAAYDGLPDDVRARIDGLTAVHDFAGSFGQAMDAAELERMREQYPPAEHPVVRTHPETGRRAIYVNEIFTSHIVGLERGQSDELLRFLCAQARIPEYQCRFRWASGSIAFWDNRSTQHYAVSDYWPARRVM
ncbi:MAG TPA: TauD/TfdA family dioxygenase, partial [Acidimicrobiia bacterium]